MLIVRPRTTNTSVAQRRRSAAPRNDEALNKLISTEPATIVVGRVSQISFNLRSGGSASRAPPQPLSRA